MKDKEAVIKELKTMVEELSQDRYSDAYGQIVIETIREKVSAPPGTKYELELLGGGCMREVCIGGHVKIDIIIGLSGEEVEKARMRVIESFEKRNMNGGDSDESTK